MNPAEHHVAVLGATPKPARYANQAIRLLLEKGYRVTPVHPRFEEIEGLAVANTLDEVPQPVHTLTLYVGPQRLEPQIPDLIALRPRRVIFNPGTESRPLQRALDEAGIPWLEGCTLVMLKTGQF
ncbi:MAG: CoA-binding protein [Gammaproteobacteria bacterium]|nr:MAG: CoA-binding protein [Gammaproteobacteria bacterium]